MHPSKFIHNKQTDALISKFILVRNSTCFGQFCLSPGVIHCTFSTGTCYTGLTTACVQDQDGNPVSSWSCTLAVVKLYMFRAVSLPSLWSYPLYNRHWHMLHKSDERLLAGSGWNSSFTLILHASSRQTSVKCARAEFILDNSWGWAEKLPETCRVSCQNKFGN